MMYVPSDLLHSPRRRIAPSPLHAARRRGSVIVLVVAVLGLLAVIGTVYIVSARTERQSAAASATGINFTFARSAIVSQVVDVIGRDNIDASGILGGYNVAGNFGGQVARGWDIPELGIVNGMGTSNYNVGYRDEPWLVSNLYRTVLSDGADARYNDMSLLNPYRFNPQSGTYDGTNLPPYYPLLATSPRFSVVDPFTTSPIPDTVNNSSHSYPRTLDAFVQLLPFSEASGIRYRYGIRIIDTNRMANVNVGAAAADTTVDINGSYLGSYALAHPDLFNNTGGDAVVNLDATWGRVGIAGAAGNTLAPPIAGLNLYQSWSRVILGFERPDTFTPTFGTKLLVSPFGLDDEMELRSYGEVGTNFTPRVAMGGAAPIWQATLAAGAFPSHRPNYTAYSYSRELRPFLVTTDANIFPGNAYTVTANPWSFIGDQIQPSPNTFVALAAGTCACRRGTYGFNARHLECCRLRYAGDGSHQYWHCNGEGHRGGHSRFPG